jgi:hypothetical protein
MSEYLGYGGIGVASRDQARSLFGQTMGYVAATAGFLALGCYLGRNLSPGWAIVAFIAAFACLIGMNFTVRRSAGLTVNGCAWRPSGRGCTGSPGGFPGSGRRHWRS